MNDAEQRVSDSLTDITAFLRDQPDMTLGLEFVLAHCVALLPVDAAGMMVVPEMAHDQAPAPVPVASSAETIRLLQDFAHAYAEGPAGETFTSGRRIDCPDVVAERRWPRFGRAARDLGFASVYTLPMRLHGQTIGAMTLTAIRPGALAKGDLDAGQVLADIGSLGVGGYQARRSELRAAQLQTALQSRVIIEQAKGLVAERLNIPVDAAFSILRTEARNSRRNLHEVAAAVLAGQIAVARRD